MYLSDSHNFSPADSRKTHHKSSFFLFFFSFWGLGGGGGGGGEGAIIKLHESFMLSSIRSKRGT